MYIYNSILHIEKLRQVFDLPRLFSELADISI